MAHVAAFIVLLMSALTAAAADVYVAVAANFAAPMKRIATDFQRATGHRALLSFGSTGKLYAQIRNGAPYQVLLAADSATPERLVGEGAAVAASRATYAIGRLALWSTDAALVDSAGAVLRSDRFRRLAIANPRLAPYGAAAQQMMRALGLEDSLRARLVTGESIGQAYQFVASGNAELGLVALSQVTVGAGSLWEVPQALHAPLRQDLVLLSAGANQPAALALVSYLRSEHTRALIREFGYRVSP